MHIEDQLKKAVGRFDWPTIEAHLNSIDAAMRADWARNFLGVIRRDGYFILRRPDSERQAKRDEFWKQLQLYYRGRGMTNLIDEQADWFASVINTENAYHQVLDSLHNDLLARLSPEQLIWATIRTVESTSWETEENIKTILAEREHIVDPLSVKSIVGSDGIAANSDDVLSMLHRALTATLKMLVYNYEWFDEHGSLEAISKPDC